MPLAPTPCLENGCGGYATRMGRCPTHQLPAWNNSTRKQRLPSDWNTRRQIILRRDKNICHVCGDPGADGVDHIIAGDDHSLKNLAPIHDRTPPFCHKYKSSQEGNAAQRGNRTKRKH
jgi:5-methylcytosine-specific restriction enzyme A